MIYLENVHIVGLYSITIVVISYQITQSGYCCYGKYIVFFLNVDSGFQFYRGADKSLARPGRKQANVSARMA